MQVIAMASIDRELVKSGTRVDVVISEGVAGATVAAFPLYDTDKKRPRV
jgi:glycine cleavage system aminomethyltransferase T